MAYTVKKFKGTSAQYRDLHYKIRKMLGVPTVCSFCGDSTRRIEWANLSGEYGLDKDDWAQMCPSCHRRYDGWGDPTVCKYGHKLTGDNLYVQPNGRYKECKKCRLARRNKTSFIGVYFDRYKSCFVSTSRSKYVGCYETLEEAISARLFAETNK